ncbi:MAG: RDD family protein, partial [Bryobacteraceae bacterium]
DGGLVLIASGLFLLAFDLFGGRLEFSRSSAPWLAGMCALIGAFYGLLWVLNGTETPGMRMVGLRLINFDGYPVERRERLIRFAGACLSFAAGGLGVAWSLADEESLAWHDHISKTFPTTIK